MTDWQPIESAPHVDRKMVLLSDGEDVVIGAWWTYRAFRPHGSTGPGGWAQRCDCAESGAYPDFVEPTHWMPLPEPPTP